MGGQSDSMNDPFTDNSNQQPSARSHCQQALLDGTYVELGSVDLIHVPHQGTGPSTRGRHSDCSVASLRPPSSPSRERYKLRHGRDAFWQDLVSTRIPPRASYPTAAGRSCSKEGTNLQGKYSAFADAATIDYVKGLWDAFQEELSSTSANPRKLSSLRSELDGILGVWKEDLTARKDLAECGLHGIHLVLTPQIISQRIPKKGGKGYKMLRPFVDRGWTCGTTNYSQTPGSQ